MTTPKRIQMTRQRPWRDQHPDAVIVARPTKWGNPFRIGQRVQASADSPVAVCFSAQQAVDAYRDFLASPIGRRFRQSGVDSGWVQNSTLSAPLTDFSICIRL